MIRIALFIIAWTAINLLGDYAFAQAPDPAQCPPNAKSCKVITLTPEEEQTLTGTDMLFDQAQWARQQFGPLIKAWRDKLQTAPAGKVAGPEPKKP